MMYIFSACRLSEAVAVWFTPCDRYSIVAFMFLIDFFLAIVAVNGLTFDTACMLCLMVVYCGLVTN